MIIANTSVPVTVLPSPHHGGLGITRSLGRLGIPVFNVDAIRWAPSFFSRHCRGAFVWDLDRADPLESLDYLLKIGQRIAQHSTLIPATDGAALLIAAYARQL